MKKFIILASLILSSFVYADEGLNKAVDYWSTQWGDGNITTGRSDISSAQVQSVKAKDLEKSLLKTVQDEILDRNDGQKTALKDLKISSKTYKSYDAVIIANAFDVGNAGEVDMKAPNKYALAGVYGILSKLTKDQNKDILTTLITASFEDGVTGSPMKTVLVALTNVKTKTQVKFFFIEGTM